LERNIPQVMSNQELVDLRVSYLGAGPEPETYNFVLIRWMAVTI
jgi:hypothetical protein